MIALPVWVVALGILAVSVRASATRKRLRAEQAEWVRARDRRFFSLGQSDFWSPGGWSQPPDESLDPATIDPRYRAVREGDDLDY